MYSISQKGSYCVNVYWHMLLGSKQMSNTQLCKATHNKNPIFKWLKWETSPLKLLLTCCKGKKTYNTILCVASC